MKKKAQISIISAMIITSLVCPMFNPIISPFTTINVIKSAPIVNDNNKVLTIDNGSNREWHPGACVHSYSEIIKINSLWIEPSFEYIYIGPIIFFKKMFGE